jgi:hypothetical protein
MSATWLEPSIDRRPIIACITRYNSHILAAITSHWIQWLTTSMWFT